MLGNSCYIPKLLENTYPHLNRLHHILVGIICQQLSEKRKEKEKKNRNRQVKSPQPGGAEIGSCLLLTFTGCLALQAMKGAQLWQYFLAFAIERI